ncbi:L,D-transpeptidase [Pseudonocardia sp. GCM10023141]|uniref:L,D-transpeptidase n=1 Tax=Pseudonocardia sp. GCM10023141 TaxID=3252653 RepID=UPI003608F6A9
MFVSNEVNAPKTGIVPAGLFVEKNAERATGSGRHLLLRCVVDGEDIGQGTTGMGGRAVGRHRKESTRRWSGPARATVLAGALGAGMLGAGTVAIAAPAIATSPSPTPAGNAAPAGNASSLVAGTPCTATAKACVDLAHNQAWLIRDGRVIRGPVPITQGATDQTTPVGTFGVQWKDQHHRSSEYNNAPMEYSVFFAPGGIAFHEGSLQKQSAGCVHLSADDAAAWYNYLQVGDQVQVH